MIKAAFFDIDGTLLSFTTHAMPPSTIRALNALRARGVRLIISSGRNISELPSEVRTAFDTFIVSNGQLCFDERGTFRDAFVDPGDVRTIVGDARAGRYDILVSLRDRTFVNRLSERVLRVGKQVNIEYREGDLEQALSNPVYQFCAFLDEGEEQQILDATTSVRTTRWHPLFCDVVPREGGKDFGVRACCERLGIRPDEAIAFGDGENDLAMFSAVGTSVAMGNAWDRVKKQADYVTDDVDADGIWNACVHFGLV